jgi:carboxypeptidase-like protein
MKRLILFIFFGYQFLFTHGQWQGEVSDLGSGEPLTGASLTLYSGGNISGLVANKEGKFVMTGRSYDSIRVSMIGYHSKTIFPGQAGRGYLKIQLQPAPAELEEVVVKKSSVVDIIRKTIAALPSFQPDDNFENKGFYREIIKDRENYFSVAEAVFLAQYFPKRESYKLKLLQGRSKEDVTFTRLFEDFHPGGGPQSVAGKSFVVEHPDFLNEKKIKLFNYKIDSLVQFDGRWLYSISFDQKPGVKEALEKGRLLIDSDTYGVISYEAENSPLGAAYIKDLSGTDKVMAGILNIELKRKGWRRRIDFTFANEKWIMSYAEAEYAMGYKQPKKNIDLDLVIAVELLFSEIDKRVLKEISNDEEWKRNNIVANLPTAFDSAFWGDNNIISPTEEVDNIIEKLSGQGSGLTVETSVDGWQYMNRNQFVSYKRTDTITLIPIMRGLWEDSETAGMLYKEIEGDFIAETRVSLVKSSDGDHMPDKGFQQAGIIVRSVNDGKQNYVLLSVGTGGNPNPKLFFKKTTDSKSRTLVSKKDNMTGWLKIEKAGGKIVASFKSDHQTDFSKVGEFEPAWLHGRVQLGLAVFAAFSGDGPKMKPDVKASFSQFEIRKP